MKNPFQYPELNLSENHKGNFVHLHLHTQYSLLDGALRLDDLFEKAKGFLSDFKIDDFLTEDDVSDIKLLLKDHKHLLELDIFEEIFNEVKNIDFGNIQGLISDFKNQNGKLFQIFMNSLSICQ